MTSKKHQKILQKQDAAVQRKQGNRKPFETMQIFCEGQTEVCYFEWLIKTWRLHAVTPLLARDSAPISVVDHAIEVGRKTPELDHLVCVFDRDEHATYQKAISKLEQENARENKNRYQAITSDPCFEVWLLLHFIYFAKPYASLGRKSAADQLKSQLQTYIPGYKPGLRQDFQIFDESHVRLAIQHAERLERHNQKTGSQNPATQIHKLIKSLLMNCEMKK